MKFEHPHFGLELDTESEESKEAFKNLQKIYSGIPATICHFCPKKKQVEADCCRHYSPPMYLIEFLQALSIIEDKNDKEKDQILVDCVHNYINADVIHQCPLLKEDNACSVYEARPFSCRMYGQYPSQEWKRRLKTVSEQLGISADKIPMKDQCGDPNVTLKGKKVKYLTLIEENKLFRQIPKLDIEVFKSSLGIDDETAQDMVYESMDSPPLTYLPFDAHYILVRLGPENLETFTQVRSLLIEKNRKKDLSDTDSLDFIKIKSNVQDFIKNIENQILHKIS